MPSQLVLAGKIDSIDKVRDIEFVHANNLFVKLSDLNSSAIKSRLKDYFKFMFVRHPLERLLSAYRSKFQDLSKHTLHFRRLHGAGIARHFRNYTNFKGPVNNVTFPEFVRYVLDKQPESRNSHWTAMERLCFPCAAQFDFVGRYEELEEHSRQLLERIGANFSFPRCGQRTHSMHACFLAVFLEHTPFLLDPSPLCKFVCAKDFTVTGAFLAAPT
jgi:hypothetical protein